MHQMQQQANAIAVETLIAAGDVQIPRLSPNLHRIVERLIVDVSSATERIVLELRGAIGDYGALSDPATLQDIHESVALNARLWYAALLSGSPPSGEQLEQAASFARRRVHQGVSLPALLRAYRVGSGGIWNNLLEAVGNDTQLYPELLRKISPYFLYHFDVIAQAVSLVYTSEQFHRAQWRDRLRHELCGVIFSRPDDVDAFRHYAQALGLDSSAPHTALALLPDDSIALTSDLDDSLDQLIIGACKLLGADREHLLKTVRHGHIVLWLPQAHGEGLVAHDQQLARRAVALLAPEQRIAQVGIGLPGSGARGWLQSADQALRAVKFGERVNSHAGVRRYSDLLLEDVVMGSEQVARYFEALLEQLSNDPGLLETLRVFFELRQHRKAVAGRLNIHPNTLNYRLQRIETLLGASLDDLDTLAKLNVALRLRQISRPNLPPV